MPFPLPAALWIQSTGPVRVDEKVVVHAAHYAIRAGGEIAFDGNVRAVYGVTTVHADRITFYVPSPGQAQGPIVRRAIAEGNIRIEDPDGEAKANRFEFDWVAGSGSASQVEVFVADMEVRAESLDLKPGEWILRNVAAKPCADGSISLAIDTLRIAPGKRASARPMRVKAGGKTLLSLPSYSTSLDRRSRGIPLPKLSLRRGAGVGISWDLDQFLDSDTLLSVGIDSYPKRRLASELQITRSFLPDRLQTDFLTPRSETSEPFSFGYLENVGVDAPAAEERYLRRHRLSLTVGTSWNQGRFGDIDGNISKPIEVIGEVGAPAGGWGALLQIRAQRIEQRGVEDMDRIVAIGSISAPSVSLAPGLGTILRFDVKSNHSGNGDDGWARWHAGIAYQPHDRFRLAAGYSESDSWGVPVFSFDRLLSPRSFHVRADLDLGSTKFSFLAKKGPENLGWYDHEYFVSQVAGCFEPYAIWRERPRRFSFGILLRPMKALEQLKDRSKRRLPGNQLPPEPGAATPF